MNKIDMLKREEFIDKFVNILNTIDTTKKDWCVALTGSWGSGKTYVIDKIYSKLESEKENLVVSYNAWKNDFYGEPLIAILYSLLDNLETSNLSDEIKQGLKNGLSAFKSMLSFIPYFDKVVDVAKNVSQSINTPSFKLKNNTNFDEYTSYADLIKNTRELIKEISTQRKIIILVDEIDRCLPEYSIKILERLHHLFEGISNLIIVISVDKEQLTKVISNYYGEKSVKSYLYKFIDFEIDLPQAILDKEVIEEGLNDYFSIMVEDIITTKTEAKEFIVNLLSIYQIRERIKIIEKAILLHNLFNKDNNYASTMCIELMYIVLKDKNISMSTNMFPNLSKKIFEDKNFYFKELLTFNMRLDDFKERTKVNHERSLLGVLLYYILMSPMEDHAYIFIFKGDESVELANSIKKNLHNFLNNFYIIN